MSLFLLTVLLLCVAAVLLHYSSKVSPVLISNSKSGGLKARFLCVHLLAELCDWLQRIQIYNLYSELGFNTFYISNLNTVFLIASSLSGIFVGVFADRFSRKMMCTMYGVFYSVCTITKVTSNLRIHMLGEVARGCATAILYASFESWYVNEHLHYYSFPLELLNSTFSETYFLIGLLKISTGVLSVFLAASIGPLTLLLFGAIIGLGTTYLIAKVWEEHQQTCGKSEKEPNLIRTMKLIIRKEKLLLMLCVIQSLYEAVSYITLFAWTTSLRNFKPQLVLIFSISVASFMIGTKLYKLLTSKSYRPNHILLCACSVGLMSYVLASYATVYSFEIHQIPTLPEDQIPFFVLVFSFVVYQISLGVYFPAAAYIRGKLIPEQYRTSVPNCFMVMKNIFIGLSVVFGQEEFVITNTALPFQISFPFNDNIPNLFVTSSVGLMLAALVSFVFCASYDARFSSTSKNSLLAKNSETAAEELQENTTT